MEFIFFIGGVIIGTIFTMIFKKYNKTFGIIDVDHSNGLCKIHITSEELSNYKTKKAIFTINHGAIISREEQTL